MKPLPILYKDHSMVAVDKPSGLLVHRTPLSRDRECVLQTLRDQLGQRVYPAHRLDRSASGVLLFALDPVACRALSLQFATQKISKRYLAVVRGYAPAQGHIDYALRKDPDKARQAAVTDYQTLATVELAVAIGRYATARYSLIAAFPKTGRRHQIRKHLAHISHPLIGDTVYGEGRHNRLFRERYGLHRLMLAAVELSFLHPVTQSPVTIVAPPAAEFARFIKAVGWRAENVKKPGQED
ncbi:MAG: tRNA pseudouridine(65) synthase TruC [Desulfobacterales bacterium]|nr:tRNA pseudouridine(65) synthase TruC [Desulfobacterales bacterium]